MPRLRPSLLVLVTTALAVAPAPAQGGRIELPEPAPAPTPVTGQEQEPAPEQPESGPQDPLPEFWAGASSPSERLFAAFEMEQDDSDEVRMRYLDDLRALGLGTETTAVKALGSPYAPTVQLAAELLEWVGDPEQEGQDVVRELVVAASRVPSVPAVSACLETARRLNQGVLPAVAVKLLGHPRRQVRTVGESRLARDPDASHVPSLLQFLRFGRDQDVRLRAARLLSAHVAQEEVRDALRATLAGEDLEVVFVALEALSGDGQPVAVGYLRDEAAQAGSNAEAAYLLHALLRLQQTAGTTPLFDEGQLALIRRLCEDRDLYVSGIGAACMAEFLFRSEYEQEMERWNALLPALLVRAVGGAEFYPQYARFLPLAENALRRITGQDFPDESRDAWLAWYEREAEGFRLVRGSLELDADALPGLRVAWSRAGGDHVLLGPEAAWQPGDRVLGGIGLEAVRAALKEAGVLEATMLPGSYGPQTEPVTARLEIALGGRRKLMSFRGLAMPAWVDTLFAALDDAWSTTRWQDLAAAGAPGPEPILQRLDAFDDAEGNGRAAALVDVSRGHLDLLDDAALVAWCAELRGAPGIADAWDLALAEEFVEQAGLRAVESPDLALELLELGLAGVIGDPAATAMATDRLAELEEPQRSALLTAALVQLGLDAAVAASGDERLAVRLAGVRALGSLGAEALPTLLAALEQEHPLVLRSALRSVGELADPAAREAVERFAQVGMPLDLHREALWALGRIGDPASVPAMEDSALRGDDAAVRIAALDALAAVDDPQVDGALARLFPEFAGGDLESSWQRAAGQRGGAALRAMLEGYLLDEDPVVSRQAAVLGGALGSPAAAPALLQLLDNMPRDPDLLEALAMTLAVDFRSMPDPAGTYRQWWRQYGELDPSEWLRRAAADGGIALDERFSESSGEARRRTVRALYDVVASGSAAQRGLAAYYLHAMTGVDTPPVLLGTPPSELSRRVAPWRAWLESN